MLAQHGFLSGTRTHGKNLVGFSILVLKNGQMSRLYSEKFRDIWNVKIPDAF